jgi:hypothetical protein
VREVACMIAASSRLGRAHGTVLVAGNARHLQRLALTTTLRRDFCSHHSWRLANFHASPSARPRRLSRALPGTASSYQTDVLVLHFLTLKSVPFMATAPAAKFGKLHLTIAPGHSLDSLIEQRQTTAVGLV